MENVIEIDLIANLFNLLDSIKENIIAKTLKILKRFRFSAITILLLLDTNHKTKPVITLHFYYWSAMQKLLSTTVKFVASKELSKLLKINPIFFIKADLKVNASSTIWDN